MKPSAKITAIVLLFVGLILVNYLASKVPTRLDATSEDIYTLSSGTHSLLSKIEEPVVLDFYYSSKAKGIPISYKNYANRVQEMLRQYTRVADGMLTLNVISPEPDTPEEEAAARAGIQPQLIQGTGEQIYFGLAAGQADLSAALGAFNPQREQFLEYDLSQLIYTVQVFDRPRLGLISSLPLQSPPFDPRMAQMGQRPPPDQFVITEWSRAFEIVPVEATATELPSGLDVLAVIHPQGLSPQLEYAIDQFLLSERPVFLALDPSSLHFRQQMNQQQMMMGGRAPNVSSDLPTLLSAYGINFAAQSVTGDLLYGATVSDGRGAVGRYPHWLQLPAEALNDSLIPTSQLNSMVLVEAGSLSLAEGSDLTFTPLLSTSEQAGEIPPMMLQFGQPDRIAREITASGTKTIAALVTGTFPSAFPNGRPEPATAPGEADSIQNPESEIPNSRPSGQGTLVIIADTDWIMDSYSIRRMNFLGTQTAQPINDNIAFANNILEYVAGSQDLISIRGKGSSTYPFTVVREIEANAQKRYQDQLAALESRISEVQSELSQLQTQAGNNGMLVASPEVAEAIAKFQTQEVEMRRERRDIRRALREDIDALETRLLLINLFAAPAFIGVFGLWFRRNRRR